MTSSNFVGRSTGRSAGLAPFSNEALSLGMLLDDLIRPQQE
jgi:hypothetical protein